MLKTITFQIKCSQKYKNSWSTLSSDHRIRVKDIGKHRIGTTM